MPLNTRLTRVWREVRRWRRPGSDSPLPVDPDLPPADLRRLSAEIQAVIETRGGLAATRRRARTIGLTYSTLSEAGRLRFFEHLATGHDRDPAAVDRAIDGVAGAADPTERRAAEAELRQALRPGHGVLLRRLTGQDGGLARLVELRADLLAHRRRSPDLAALDAELRQILENRFDVGLLQLVQLTWDTPASLLEKLIEYEAVHAIESWEDLKRRLSAGRRCYAFFHPGMPDDPLIFVEVALTEGIPARLDPLLEAGGGPDDPLAGGPPPHREVAEERADTAVFYSISNCHAGLAGVSLGDFLIKSVAEELAAELGALRTFVTLSPLPGFRRWLRELLTGGGRLALAAIDPATEADEAQLHRWLTMVATGPLLSRDDDDLERLRPVISHLAARYVTETGSDGRAIDSVAHFHLSNGARVERLNWMANPSRIGWERGLGLMVNYRYELRTIEENHARYTGSGEVVVSDEVRTLLKPSGGDGRRRWR